jgi:VTC domain
MLNTSSFGTILLNEMDQVKLMNRTDRKYWFSMSHLQEILDYVKSDYFILNIDGEDQQPYTTTYFDTVQNEMYTNHHNGKLNRFKIRKRTYVQSGISFLEIKFKSNKGRTIKKRIPTTNILGFSPDEQKFIYSITSYSVEDLSPTLINEFKRITLVNKNFNERCTIDIDLRFQYGNARVNLNDLVVVEIKSDASSSISPLAFALREFRVRKSGFSKYCVGRSLTEKNIKRNAFKKKIRRIEKINHSEEQLY